MTAPSSEVLLVEQRGPIAQFVLNRPHKCNALNIDLNLALSHACESLTSEVTIVLLRAAGKHFCAGSDLTELHQVDRQEAERVIRIEMDACHAIAALPQLTVAVLQGKSYGGGAILPLYCDIRIARPGIELALPEVALGWSPPYGVERLLANLPKPFVLDILFSGRTCGDKEALERGWVHRCMTEEEELAYLDHLARIPLRTLTDTRVLANSRDMDKIREADEKAFAAFLNHFDTEHARSRIAEFMERKRS